MYLEIYMDNIYCNSNDCYLKIKIMKCQIFIDHTEVGVVSETETLNWLN